MVRRLLRGARVALGVRDRGGAGDGSGDGRQIRRRVAQGATTGVSVVGPARAVVFRRHRLGRYAGREGEGHINLLNICTYYFL